MRKDVTVQELIFRYKVDQFRIKMMPDPLVRTFVHKNLSSYCVTCDVWDDAEGIGTAGVRGRLGS